MLLLCWCGFGRRWSGRLSAPRCHSWRGVLECAPGVDVDFRSWSGVAWPPAGQDVCCLVEADRRGHEGLGVEPGGILLDSGAEAGGCAEDASGGDVLEGDGPGVDQAGLAGPAPEDPPAARVPPGKPPLPGARAPGCG